MKRRKSLMIPAILLLCLFFISGCGDGIPEGTLNTTGGTITLTSNLAQITGEGGLLKDQGCILTATLTDNSLDPSTKDPKPRPISGQVIAFNFKQNESGAILIDIKGGITNKDGQARCIYRAGSDHAGLNVQDIILAERGDIADAIAITRLGGAAQKGSGYYLTFTDGPTGAVTGGSKVKITAYVTDNTTDKVPIKDVIVTFSIVDNVSGGELSVTQARTDALGTAFTIYTAGKPTATVQDVIQASVTSDTGTGSTNALVITVNP